MLDNNKNKKDRLEELLKIVSISDEELEKLTYKEKQKYYRAKINYARLYLFQEISKEKD